MNVEFQVPNSLYVEMQDNHIRVQQQLRAERDAARQQAEELAEDLRKIATHVEHGAAPAGHMKAIAVRALQRYEETNDEPDERA